MELLIRLLVLELLELELLLELTERLLKSRLVGIELDGAFERQLLFHGNADGVTDRDAWDELNVDGR